MNKRIFILIFCALIVFGLVGYIFFTKNAHGNTEPLSSSLSDLEANISNDLSDSFEDNAPIPPTKAESLGLPNPPDLDITEWNLILVNSTHTIDASFAPETGTAHSRTSSCEQDARICDSLNQLALDGETAGLPIYLSSGYRSYAQQDANLKRKLNEGMPYEKAITIVAPPGSSEHQTGLCCDITDVYHPLKSPSELEQTPTYQWLYEHCAEYGFILRYPKDKTDITGIIYEPWHFRYVGTAAATYIMKNRLCLEEFLSLYD